MARYGRKKRPSWTAVPTWSVLALIAGWGLWQVAQFRHTLLVQTAAARGESTSPNATEPDLSAAIADPAPDSPPTAATSATIPATQVADADRGNETVGDGSTAIGGSVPSVQVDTEEEANVLMRQGVAYLDEGRVVEGRTSLNAALELLEDAADTDPRPPKLRQQLSNINEGVFLGSAILPEDSVARYVDVHYGDSFQKIGHRYGVSTEFLAAINPSLNPRNLKLTSGVKIVEGPFNLRLVKHAERIDLYAREWYVRSYGVRLEEGTYLPRGTYRVRSGGKIRVGPKVWIGFDGAEAETRDVSLGWIYGDSGPRAGNSNDNRSSGMKLAENDLHQVYDILVETKSLLRVEQ